MQNTLRLHFLGLTKLGVSRFMTNDIIHSFCRLSLSRNITCRYFSLTNRAGLSFKSPSFKLTKIELDPIQVKFLEVASSLINMDTAVENNETDLITNGTTNGTNGITTNGENDALKAKGHFDLFPISKRTKKTLKANGIEYLFPVQTSTFNQIYEGNNLIVKSQTGTGKTFAFLIPIIEKIRKNKDTMQNAQALILAPTRELAKQISDCVAKISKEYTSTAVYGGAPIHAQLKQLAAKPTFVVCTPGRLKDLLENHGFSLDNIQFVVLDECDRMLDMGFLPDVNIIMSYMYNDDRKKPQTLVFSATVPMGIQKSIDKYIGSNECEIIDLVSGSEMQTPETVEHWAMECMPSDRPSTIAKILKVYCGNHKQAIVFCQTKREADTLSTSTEINIDCHVLHGDIPQDKREMIMKGFRKGKYRVLITTDVAARGLDIPDVDLVVVCSPPNDSVDYVHRSGRTGRAGRSGLCICLYTHYQSGDINAVERETGINFKRVNPPSGDKMFSAFASDAAKSLAAVTEEVRTQFLKSAEEILSSMEAEQALAAALAVIAGCEKQTKASLLTGVEGKTTYVFKSAMEQRGCGLLFTILKKILGDDTNFGQICGKIMFTQDSKESYFEVQSDLDELIQGNWTDNEKFQMFLATEIPENLKSSRDINGGDGNDRRSGGGRGGFNRGGRSGFGGRGGGNRSFGNRPNFNDRKRQGNGFSGNNSFNDSQNKITKLDSD